MARDWRDPGPETITPIKSMAGPGRGTHDNGQQEHVRIRDIEEDPHLGVSTASIVHTVPGFHYMFRVKAINEAGESQWAPASRPKRV